MIVPNRFKAFSNFELACILEGVQTLWDDGSFANPEYERASDKWWAEFMEEIKSRGIERFPDEVFSNENWMCD